ncbi:MAG TPA: ribosomal protein S18-alanine N-acetyltransferase [Thermodesulfovibrionales bacterium]|nr:ribosomal protein S18-alanine N-acetyltransferase [Thermodesulfovibrionales bacterium]
MKKILIRDMREGDIPHVVQIERLSFPTPWSETSFLNEIYKLRSLARVAIFDEVIAGYLCAEQVLDEGHILNLAVHPDFRGMGVAKVLVKQVMEEMRQNGCRVLYLEVRSSNAIAKRLYERFGFRVIGTRKRYYVTPEEDAIIMAGEIPCPPADQF